MRAVSKALFYLLSITWGLPMTLCGAVVALCLLLTGHRPQRWGGCWHFKIGRGNWGGLSLGLVILTSPDVSERTKNHEHGHAVQNCILGPSMVLLSIGSAARYHYINYLERTGKTPPRYDGWWFEGEATKIGQECIKLWEV